MANFGWSYPAGCSGTPYDDDLEPVCSCGHLESDHDEDSGACLEAGCDCSGFAAVRLEDVDVDLPDYDDGGVEDVEIDSLPGDEVEP